LKAFEESAMTTLDHNAFMKAFREGLDKADATPTDAEMNAADFVTVDDPPAVATMLENALAGLRVADHDPVKDRFLAAYRHGHAAGNIYDLYDGLLRPTVAPPKDHFLERLLEGGGAELPGQDVLGPGGAKAPANRGRSSRANERQTNPKDNGQASGWRPEQEVTRPNVRAGEAPFVLSKAAREMLAPTMLPSGAPADAPQKRAAALPPEYRGLIFERMLLAAAE
jgi:hypothetical protein